MEKERLPCSLSLPSQPSSLVGLNQHSGAGSGERWGLMSPAAIVLAEGRASGLKNMHAGAIYSLGLVWERLKMNYVITGSHSKILGFYSSEPAILSFVQLKYGELAVQQIRWNSYKK